MPDERLCNVFTMVHYKKAILNETAGSSYQKDEAGRMAWNAPPGVLSVHKEPRVDYNNSFAG